MTYTVWDIETSTRTSFKRKANPFDPENFVVMSGYKRQGGDVVGEYFGRAGQQGGSGLPADWFTKLLDGTDTIVGANIKFDLLYALREPRNLEAWMAWVASGNLVWDIQLAEYLLEGMDPASHMLSLDELSPRYGGNVKFDEVKSLWQAGVSTEDINPDLLRRYLCGSGDEHGDIGNTELVYLGQVERAKASGQYRSILLNMGSLLCTVEMERNGMAVDVPLGKELAADLSQQIAALSVELNSYLPADLPFEFNWASGPQKSALIFGGAVKYQKRVAVLDDAGKPTYAQKDEVHYVLEDGTTMEVSWWEHLAATEWGGEVPEGKDPVCFKGGKNAGERKTKKVKVNDIDKPKMRWEDFYYRFEGVTKPKPEWAGKTEGVYSTSADVIKELGSRNIPFLKSLAKIGGLTKDLTTYYITTDPETGVQTGMLTLVQADGIIHHMLNHTSTVTARFSSSNPNLQNLPKEGKSEVKRIFKSRFEGGNVIQSDFKSLEVFVQAILTRCKQLIEDLLQGLDMHCVRVSQAEGISYEKALDLCVKQKLPEWDKKRTKAKIFSFQRAYGAGAPLIAEQTGMTLSEVEALIDAENTRYPEIEAFYTGPGGMTDQIKAGRIPTGQFFVHPAIPAITCNPGKSFYRTPDKKLYTFREGASPDFMARRGVATSFSPTEIKNYPVQGTGGEWAKAAMWLAIRAFYARKNFDGRALLVNQVHDALYADAAPEVTAKAALLLHACMEEASTFMEWWFDWPIPVAVPSDTGWGPTMYEEARPPEGWSSHIPAVRQFIRNAYIAGHTPSCEQPLAQAA